MTFVLSANLVQHSPASSLDLDRFERSMHAGSATVLSGSKIKLQIYGIKPL